MYPKSIFENERQTNVYQQITLNIIFISINSYLQTGIISVILYLIKNWLLKIHHFFNKLSYHKMKSQRPIVNERNIYGELSTLER